MDAEMKRLEAEYAAALAHLDALKPGHPEYGQAWIAYVQSWGAMVAAWMRHDPGRAFGR